MRNTRLYLIVCVVTLLIGAPLAAAEKASSALPVPDRIEVIAHVPLSGGLVTDLTTGSHWRKEYLYLDHGPAARVTIMDVTNPAAPIAAGELDVPKQEAAGDLTTVVGTAALVASSPSEPALPTMKRTVTVLSFADPEHPTVTRHFSGVTALVKDTERGLIYLANADGLWVLRVMPAPDIQYEKLLDKQYQHHILYDH
jgi:hypothetical protein